MNWPTNNNVFYGENCHFTQWQKQVLAHADIFSTRDENSWLLFDADSYQFSVLFFALLVAKKAIVLPQNGQPEQLNQCLAHADAFAGDANIGIAPVAYNAQLIAAEIAPLEIDENTLIRFFTSGSSGTPKAIDKQFSQLLQEVGVLEAQFGEQLADSMMVATVSHQHIYGLLFKVLWPLYTGRDVCLKSFEYPEHLLHFIRNENEHARQYTLISSPAYYHRLVQDNVLTSVCDQLVCCFSSGGPLQSNAADLLTDQFGFAPVEVLGSTETGGIAWRQQSSASFWQVFSPIGIKLDELERLIIASPYVEQGQWYQTDDRAQLLNETCFNLLGRADRIVKIEEKRCSLDEITSRITQHPAIEECYILLLEPAQDSQKRSEIAAVLVLNEEGELALSAQGKFKFSQAIKSHLKAFFEPLVIPRKFRYLAALPYNSQGKLKKAQLEKLFD